MREPGRVITAMAFAGVAAIAATPSDAAGKKHSYMRSGAYDGLWSVSIRTKAGPCDAAYRYPARIVGGRIVQADSDFSYQISGAVVGSGAIAVTVSKGLGTATGFGRLRGATGYGRWTAGNQCSGTWSAMRRAAN
ncbi:MAG TPA: hypothetical protein VHX43_04715 [Xanthobacteraceae bacterium]|jgi:hypothetical protein|nr:hypothetical protein [Xanthobacteraceae bacterium]